MLAGTCTALPALPAWARQPGAAPTTSQPTPQPTSPSAPQPGTSPTATQPVTPGGGVTALGPAEKQTSASLLPFENRLIREIKVTGLKQVSETLVRNQLRTQAGRPLRVETVEDDIRRINRLGAFREITAKVQAFDDQTVELILTLTETPVIKAVQSVGNRQLSDQELGAEIDVLAGTAVDRFQLDRSLRKIKDLYKKKGFYQADVSIDEAELAETGIVLFRIREGERLKITDIRFTGNTAFDDSRLHSQVKSREWGLLDSGALDDVTLDQDIAALINFYKDRGYLDIRADREIRPSPDGREAVLTFLVQEGPIYTLRSIKLDTDDGRGLPAGNAPTIFTTEQIAGLMQIKAGDVYSVDKIRKSMDAVSESYGKLGYADARVTRVEMRDIAKPEVDLVVLVTEGRRYSTGVVFIKGNELTQQKIIRRQVRVLPDRPLDTVELKESEQNLKDINLFDRQATKLTLQPPEPSSPEQRDVLVEIKETNTGSLQFGAAVSSDAGLLGQISLNQRNFDVGDTPDSWDEFIKGKAFRGAGQGFSIVLQPGTQVQNYLISLSDDYLFESDYGGSINGGLRSREYDEYNEQRLGAGGGLGRRFGSLWYGSVRARGDLINIDDVSAASINDLRAVEGESMITGLTFTLRRSTLNSFIRPTRGTKLDLSVERVGALGGDYNFTKLGSQFTAYFTIAEDFLGRKTVLSIRNNINYTPEGVDSMPIFERYFMGGRDFRGFKFRGVSPRGLVGTTPSADPSGGNWAFFAGAEIEQPVFGDTISFVVFADSGTVTTKVGLDEYRVAVGLGMRLYIPQLGPAPLAFDFGFPIMKQDGDKTRSFSFALDLPF